jgi:transglutaminase-like putative cysteine protease
MAMLAVLPGCAGMYFHPAAPPEGPAPRFSLDQLPYREYWTGIVFNGEKVGFGRLRIDRAEGSLGRFDLATESAMRFTLLGFEKHVTLRSRDRVNDDLSLVEFEYEYNLDGNRLALEGNVRDQTLQVSVRNADRETQRTFTLDGPVHPVSALALLPAMRGLEPGAHWRVRVFSGEAQELADATQRVVAYEKSELLPQPGWKVATDLLGFGTSTWYDHDGRPQLEIALNGIIISYLESETTARGYLAEAAVNKRELLLDFSMVTIDVPIRAPRSVTSAKLAVRSPARMDLLPQDAAQRCAPADQGVVCEIRAIAFDASPLAPGTGLEASVQVPTTDPTIRRLAADIAGNAPDDARKADALIAWIQANIAKEAADAFSALDVLQQRRAECQGHAWLYAALARSLGIPTRVVNGLTYSDEWGGFLYHTWDESRIGGQWVAVDPTFGERRADAARLKIAYGESSLSLLAIADWIGQTRIQVLAYE